MNPVPHAELWLKEALPLMTEDERREELAYYRDGFSLALGKDVSGVGQHRMKRA